MVASCLEVIQKVVRDDHACFKILSEYIHYNFLMALTTA